VVFHMSSGASVIFNDPRRFGYMKIIARGAIEEEPLLKGLGPEPLGNAFDAAMLARSCANKKTSLKAALLDQRVVAGLGNIYVCEALFRSQLSPRRLAATLATKKAEPTDHAKRLVTAIHAVLNQAIKAGGSSRANSAISSTRFRSTTAKAKNARPKAVAASSGDLPRTGARRSGVRNVRHKFTMANVSRMRRAASGTRKSFQATNTVTSEGNCGNIVGMISPEAESSPTIGCSSRVTTLFSLASTHCQRPRTSSADLLVGAYSTTDNPMPSAS
jgi:hypothetical protein